jgi:hypothetical protein
MMLPIPGPMNEDWIGATYETDNGSRLKGTRLRTPEIAITGRIRRRASE